MTVEKLTSNQNQIIISENPSDTLHRPCVDVMMNSVIKVYGKYTFAAKVKGYELDRPKIALLLGNRFTQLKGAAHAFKALSNEAIQKMYEEYNNAVDRFVEAKTTVTSLSDFENEFSVELRDFNSAGVVAANQGLPLSQMNQHTYEVYDVNIQVSKKQRELCKAAIEELVNRL